MDLFRESDSENEVAFKTENEYAKKYDAWREKEEKHKLESKYGDGNLEDSSSEDDDEDLEVTESFEKDFLKTLSLLKKKDARIYDPNFKCFSEELSDKKEKKITNGNQQVEEKSQTDLLRKAFNEDDDSDGDEVFEVEEKVEEEKKEDLVKDYLKGKVDHINADTEQDLDALKTLWSDPKLNDGEAFLRDYILDRRYLDDDGKDNSEEKLRDDEGLEEDENTIEEQGKFERAYNFRFEEPDQEYLKRYPRTMNHIRPKDNKRSMKRAEVKQRKVEEKQKKMEEISRLKSLKLKEITEKIAKLKEITGNEEMAFQEEDIIGDFDPDEHDRKMQELFNDEYYGEQDTEKPVFPDLDEELELENWDNYEEELKASGSRQHRVTDGDDGPHCEDGDFNMDAEYDPSKPKTLLEEIQETLGKKKRHRKRKNKLAKILASDKPKFDPLNADHNYSEYMEEYYKMDCEDIIGGDLPCRFKYRDVVPNSYGLTIEEILLADDRELNQWVPLKKTVKLRPDFKEKGDVKTYQKRAEDITLKKKLLPSLFREEVDKENPPNAPKKKKNKKKKKSKTETEISNAEDTTLQKVNIDEDIAKFYENNEAASSIEASSSTAHDEIDGSDASKKKRKKNKTKNETSIMSNETETTNCISSQKDDNSFNNSNNDDSVLEESVNDKKSKKKKHNQSTLSCGPSNGDITEDLKPSTELFNSNKRNVVDESVLLAKKVKRNKKKQKVGSLLKQKSNNIGKLKNQKGKENPMSNISDERLKAYGLNPKKYRSFLKYKKQ